jgi:hypothetical protein
MTSFFTFKKTNSPKQRPEKSSPQNQSNFFSFKKPQREVSEEEIFGQKEEIPKSFTEKVSESLQDIEGTEREIERNTARGLSRMGERVLGFPGDLQDFVKNIFGLKSDIGIPLPTSSQLQESSENFFQGYTTPQTEFEEKSDELLGDIASSIYGRGGKTFKSSLGLTIGIPVMGNLAKEGLSYAGVDEKKQAYGKMGTMAILDIASQRFGRGGAKKYANQLFSEAEEAINLMGSGHTADATGLNRALDDLQRTLSRGGKSTSKTPALDKIKQAKSKISSGRIDPRELVEFRKTINEAIEELGGWQLQLPKPIKNRAINNLNKVKSKIIEAGEHYGRTQNAPFLKKWQSANEASAVYHKSNLISNFIKKHFPGKIASPATKLLFGVGPSIGAIGGVGGAALGTGITAGVAGLNETAKIFYRITKSPVLKKHYSNIIKAAAENDVAKFTSNLKLLDKELAKSEKREKEEIKRLTKD